MNKHRFPFIGLMLFLATGMAMAVPRHVILVITDDQGYGDIGIHGNEMIKTPNLDTLHGKSVRLTDYHVDPTCSPTRSALMSGRYSSRTGVWHTILGRSLMRSEEVTIAERFRGSGFRTGMFGKWHLGDNYPLRPLDQGFDTAVWHKGGGVGQGPDYWGNDYFDDSYWRNNKPEKFSGYCTDIWFAEAMKFIETNRERPSFCYLSTNAPHGPYLVDPKYSQPYLDAGVPGSMAKFYGMITNIDENMGKLMAFLKENDLEKDTMLIFTTDNGTAAGVGRKKDADSAWRGFNAGMRGQKGSPYDGGHRVPFFVHWPGGGMDNGRDFSGLCAHIDVLPTLADYCGLYDIMGPKIDGISLRPFLDKPNTAYPDRTIPVHSQRILNPIKWRQSSVMTKRWRMVNGKELFDMENDSAQETNVATEQPEVMRRLQDSYEDWWESLEPAFTRDVAIGVGAPDDPDPQLHSHDWQLEGEQCPWHQNHIKNGALMNGEWVLEVLGSDLYEIELRRWPREIDKPMDAHRARLIVGGREYTKDISKGSNNVLFRAHLQGGRQRLKAIMKLPDGKERGSYYAYVRRVNPL